jgi:hypothetical protein
VTRHALKAWGLGWVAVSRLALIVPGASPPRWLGWIDRLAARLPTLSSCSPDDAARAVTQAARLVSRTRCLAWSLALHGLLAQAGMASELRIGVAADGDAGVAAHAWLECAGRTWSWVAAGSESTEGYVVLWPRAASRSARSSA